MVKDLKVKISYLHSLLSEEQKAEDILEVDNNLKNHDVIEYLENIGAQKWICKTTAKLRFGKTQEKSRSIKLWYKRLDGTWVIKLWEINRIRQ